jgi:CMP-N-acetylneuraminic acid synthetase
MTLALIPARGGSKGIPRKNVREIAGKPLIAWTIEAALAAEGISRVVVSTEDEEIAAVARQCGADVPFMRPAELATDDAPGIAPILHAAQQLPQHEAILLLQPTSPLRGHRHIEGLLAVARSGASPSVVSVSEVREHPAWMFRRAADGRLERIERTEGANRRQDLPALYSLNGAMYWVRTDWLRREEKLVGIETLGFVMDEQSSVDIDTPLDWRLAELLLAERRGRKS